MARNVMLVDARVAWHVNCVQVATWSRLDMEPACGWSRCGMG